MLWTELIKKDLKATWPVLAALWIVLIAMVVIFSGEAFGTNYFLPILPAFTVQEIVLFLGVGLVLLQDRAKGSNAFWMTRPLPGWRLACSKLLVVTVAVVIPVIYVQYYLANKLGVAGDWLETLIGLSVLWVLALSALAAMTAVVSSSLVAWISVVALGYPVLIGFAFAYRELIRDVLVWAGIYSQETFDGVFYIGMLMGICLAFGIVVWQYQTRRAVYSWIGLGVSAFLLAGGLWNLGVGLYMHPVETLFHPATNVAPVPHLIEEPTVELVPRSSWLRRYDRRLNHRYYSPFIVFGNKSPDVGVSFESVTGELLFADGHSCKITDVSHSYSKTGEDGIRVVSGIADPSQTVGYSLNRVLAFSEAHYNKYATQPGQLRLHITYSTRRYFGDIVLPAIADARYKNQYEEKARIAELTWDDQRLDLDIGVYLGYRHEGGLGTSFEVVLRNPVRREFVRHWPNRGINARSYKLALSAPKIHEASHRLHLNENDVGQPGHTSSSNALYQAVRLPLPSGWMDDAEVVLIGSEKTGEFSKSITIDNFRLADW